MQRVLAACGLVLMSPIMAVIAVAIRLESPGPCLFRQQRKGLNERRFTALKFRSMRSGSEGATKLGVGKGDPRITRVGRVIRATKLDELPQLWNIARGEMLFVGPRPIPLALDAKLRERIPGFGSRYALRPGLTSLAQVCVHDNGLDERLIEDWRLRFEAERRYIAHASISYDLTILAMTAMYVARSAVRR